MRYFICFFTFFILFPNSGWSQESEYKINIDWNHERHIWHARWITHPTASVYDYGVFNFRLEFKK